VGLAHSTTAVIVVRGLRDGHNNNIIVIYDEYLHKIIGGAVLWGESQRRARVVMRLRVPYSRISRFFSIDNVCTQYKKLYYLKLL